MNWKQILILIGALAVIALILWHDFPIKLPGVIIKMLLLFVKLSAVIAVAIFAYIFAGGRNKPS